MSGEQRSGRDGGWALPDGVEQQLELLENVGAQRDR